MLWMILTSSTKPLFAFIVRRKRPLPFAPCVTNPIGYSGSIFLIKPGGDPVVTCGSTPWRCACTDEKPACSAIKLITAIFNE